MPRNISFRFTTQQIRDRTKTVTRRDGWRDAKPGDVLQGVVQSMGLKKGEKVEKLRLIRLIDVRREPLGLVCDPEEMALEGFPEMEPAVFLEEYFPRKKLTDEITRIEFEYVD